MFTLTRILHVHTNTYTQTHTRRLSYLAARHVIPLIPLRSPPSVHPNYSLCVMALRSNSCHVYVALLIALFFIINNASVTGSSGQSSDSLSGLLPPYDELYYRGVRAYFMEEWERAAEFIEKSISTRETLLKTRRRCHDECLSAGDDRLSKLGKCIFLYISTIRVLMHDCHILCVSKAYTPKH